MNLVEFKQGEETVSINPAAIVLVQDGGENSTMITLNVSLGGNPKIIYVDDSYRRVCNLINDALEI